MDAKKTETEGKKTLKAVEIENLKPGMIVNAAPGKLIVEDVLTTQSLKAQQKDKHPHVVLSVNAEAQEITVTYVASFAKAGTLADVKIVDSAKKLLLPVAPAPKEFDLDFIKWEYHWEQDHVGCWVSIRSKKVLAGPEFKVFDQFFSVETATYIDSLIKTVVD